MRDDHRSAWQQRAVGRFVLAPRQARDRIKVIVWDRHGLAIWYKRSERGKYRWPTREYASIELTAHELELLLDRVDFTRIRRLPPFELHAQPP